MNENRNPRFADFERLLNEAKPGVTRWEDLPKRVQEHYSGEFHDAGSCGGDCPGCCDGDERTS